MLFINQFKCNRIYLDTAFTIIQTPPIGGFTTVVWGGGLVAASGTLTPILDHEILVHLIGSQAQPRSVVCRQAYAMITVITAR
jgi:hypothetical protein